MTTLVLTTLLAFSAALPAHAQAPVQPVADLAPESCQAAPPEAAQPKKKRGPSSGALFGAARHAGLGEALLGNNALLGDSKGGQIAGAVVGAAVASRESAQSVTGMLSGLSAYAGSDSARVAQAAGLATGVAREWAKGDGRTDPETCAPAEHAR